ncbi:diphthine--ammonia ligase [Halobacillus naozhouensis]|uniref:Diphthine--ammonia ligase n=1 Tax=Halobacillus naozhouensis TaxID=554880 RepID=A0ABY8J1P5_9BACI|nr:diphthine--ammonia ligase [Halobacillus naozhouensis]WFT74690.1 diphthine--ammonia ligase [Halobacillus naozhouensis]
MENVIVSWSGGKDSTLALYYLMNNSNYRIRGLLSTTSQASGRLPVHEVRREFIQAQAKSLELPLYDVPLPPMADNSTYERTLQQKFKQFKSEGIYTIVYADLFLEDIKDYRDRLLSTAGMSGLYPLWGKASTTIAEEFISAGFKAIVTAVDTEQLTADQAGCMVDKNFINSLPPGVDPCGENGEFHTFVVDGPIFHSTISVQPGNQFETGGGKFAHIELMKE